jgi:hypothetical protein
LLNETGSVAGAIEALAEKTVHAWSYGRFADYVQRAIDLLAAETSLDPALMNEIAEMSATRDTYVHANGIANREYLANAGALARTGLGRKLEMGQSYLSQAEQALGRFIDEVEESIPERIKALGKASAFREMWDATSLAKTVPFDEGWLVESEDMVRSKKAGLAAEWAHTEQMLRDFFLAISNESSEGQPYDVSSALWRFSPASNEGKVIASWISSPFWF